jgi:DNA (cytosine-5)-methyltransferase 1
MPLDAPAPTVTTASNRVGSDYTIHPTEDRLMSPKECARLQKFPKDFRWRDSDTDVHAIDKFGVGMVREVIGEAIPPEFTRQHGEVLANLLKGNLEEVELIASGDERCTKAEEKLGLERSLFGDRASPSSSIPQS